MIKKLKTKQVIEFIIGVVLEVAGAIVIRNLFSIISQGFLNSCSKTSPEDCVVGSIFVAFLVNIFFICSLLVISSLAIGLLLIAKKTRSYGIGAAAGLAGFLFYQLVIPLFF